MPHQRNIEGLKIAARTKAETTRQRVEETLRQMTQSGKRQPINFKTVAEAAGVSTACVSSKHLVPKWTFPKANALLMNPQNADLRKHLEVAYGLVHAHMT